MEKLFVKVVFILLIVCTTKVVLFWCIQQINQTIKTGRTLRMRIYVKKTRNRFNKLLKGKKLTRDDVSNIVEYLYRETRYKKTFNGQFKKAHYIYSCFKHCSTLEYKHLKWVNMYLDDCGR